MPHKHPGGRWHQELEMFSLDGNVCLELLEVKQPQLTTAFPPSKTCEEQKAPGSSTRGAVLPLRWGGHFWEPSSARGHPAPRCRGRWSQGAPRERLTDPSWQPSPRAAQRAFSCPAQTSERHERLLSQSISTSSSSGGDSQNNFPPKAD